MVTVLESLRSPQPMEGPDTFFRLRKIVMAQGHTLSKRKKMAMEDIYMALMLAKMAQFSNLVI